MREIFPSGPIVTYKRGRNLRDLLVHRKTRGLVSKKGFGKSDSCGKESVICRRMYAGGDRVSGLLVGHVMTYDRTIGCKSVNVIMAY